METDKISLLAYKNDYYVVNNKDLTDSHLNCFNCRPHVPLKHLNSINTGIYKTDFEECDEHIKKCVFYYNKFYLSDDSEINIKQYFFNISFQLPAVSVFEHNMDYILGINSMFMSDIYADIIYESNLNKDDCQFVYTKTYYVCDNNNMFDDKPYYIIPHINVYDNMHIFGGKSICELTGTII